VKRWFEAQAFEIRRWYDEPAKTEHSDRPIEERRGLTQHLDVGGNSRSHTRIGWPSALAAADTRHRWLTLSSAQNCRPRWRAMVSEAPIHGHAVACSVSRTTRSSTTGAPDGQPWAFPSAKSRRWSGVNVKTHTPAPPPQRKMGAGGHRDLAPAPAARPRSAGQLVDRPGRGPRSDHYGIARPARWHCDEVLGS